MSRDCSKRAASTDKRLQLEFVDRNRKRLLLVIDIAIITLPGPVAYLRTFLFSTQSSPAPAPGHPMLIVSMRGQPVTQSVHLGQ